MTDPNDLNQSLRDMKSALRDTRPGVIRFLIASWNLCMKSLIAIKAMPYIVKMPWLLIVIAILLIALCPYFILLIAPLAYIAISKKANAATNFLIPLFDSNTPLDNNETIG